MSEMKETLKELLFSRPRDLHGKKRFLSLLLAGLLAFAGGFIGVYAIERLPYRVYQLFILCVILWLVWQSAVFWQKYHVKQDQTNDQRNYRLKDQPK